MLLFTRFWTVFGTTYFTGKLLHAIYPRLSSAQDATFISYRGFPERAGSPRGTWLPVVKVIQILKIKKFPRSPRGT